jgi:protein gp37
MIKVETRKSDNIAKLSALWNGSGIEFSRGYLAGIFDAEGSFGTTGGNKPGSLRISNTNEAYLGAIITHGNTVGFKFKIENFHGRYCKTARLYGSLDEIGRFFGEVRPALSYKKQAAFGSRIEGRTPRVIAVEYVGERDLVDIQTSKRTFIANGYLTHNCYASTFAERFRGVKGHPYEQGFDLRLVPEKLAEPFRWTARRRVFVNSMSDLFHPEVPDEYVVRVARVMAAADWHTYQVLTKRSERMAELLRTKLRFAADLPHVWWGVSVENRRHGLPRIEHLRTAPATVRFLSVEPLLEDLGRVDFTGIHWVIVGGESGHGARPMAAEWVRSLRNQCRESGVSFFFKQWGGVRKSETGRKLDDRTHDDQPVVRDAEMPARCVRLQMLDACSECVAN